MTAVVLVNQTTVLTDSEVEAVVPVLQTMFDRDFEPVWATGLAVKVSVAGEATVNADAWVIYLQDTTNVPGAGGYHIDDSTRPTGYVFVKDAMEANESWTVDLTHEFLEMCSDPTTDVLVALPTMPGYSCLREVGDAVEEDTLGYKIDGVLVTDWCTPEYFYQTAADGGQGTVAGNFPRGKYDFMNHIDAPAPALLHGGYLGIQDPNGQWGQVSMFDEAGTQSRRSKRTMGRLNRRLIPRHMVHPTDDPTYDPYPASDKKAKRKSK
jgi:hypothetical protein